ncbi:MAG: alpha-amylase family glycosyl hydrolase [Eubacterium sp.]|nr:alpha-amylase family glycosyl hydrolase [Eubacterium sp.]
MAENTNLNLRNQVIYQIFVRQYSEEGTFEAVRRDLDRIRDLGVDIIYFAPIYPIGEAARKGSWGSPYSIRDYRAVDPAYGTMDDFKNLVSDIHARGMKCMLDIVYNHTSRDSVLVSEHPEWFYHKEDGSLGNRIGDWTDVADLDYSHADLWDYQIQTLVDWAQIVDGFRCDVAPLVPLDFWKKARAEVSKVRPDCIWMAESVEPSFIRYCRSLGIPALSDSELYQAFDIDYDYDISDTFYAAVEGKTPLSELAAAINQQETIYPAGYIKLRCLENHDRARAAFLFPNREALLNWTAFIYFQKGIAMLYAGQEFCNVLHPSLFEREPFSRRTGDDLTSFLKRLFVIRKNPTLTDSSYHVSACPGNFLVAEHVENKAVERTGAKVSSEGRRLIGIFSCDGRPGLVKLCGRGPEEGAVLSAPIEDGTYENLIDHESYQVYEGHLSSKGLPVIFGR